MGQWCCSGRCAEPAIPICLPSMHRFAQLQHGQHALQSEPALGKKGSSASIHSLQHTFMNFLYLQNRCEIDRLLGLSEGPAGRKRCFVSRLRLLVA